MKDEQGDEVSNGRESAVGPGGPVRRVPRVRQPANMNWKARIRVWIATCLCAGAAGSVAGGDYLAMEGPPPLRFKSRAKPGGEKVVLPPLALSSADTAESTGSTSEDDSLLATVEPPDMGSTQPTQPIEPAPEPITIPPAALTSPTLAPGLQVTPQILLSYFGAAGTNGVNSVVVAPVSFIPPQPGAPASSRATYRQVP